MKEKNYEIKIVKTWPENELVNLYKAGGWWKDSYDKSKLKDLINGSFVFAVLIDESGKTVGMGRVLSDGISDAYIQDLVVLPEHRNKGLGKELVKKLIEFCHSKGVKWIGLIAEPDQEDFYKKLGFKQMNRYVPLKFEE